MERYQSEVSIILLCFFDKYFIINRLTSEYYQLITQ